MAEPRDAPQLYLISPPMADVRFFASLASLLDATDVACLRMVLASEDADDVARACDGAREVAHARDVPVVVAHHVALAARLGLDGVHLEGTRGLRDARKALGEEAIVGAFCGASRHDGLIAGETGADYVAFGPVGETGLSHGPIADPELFAWWSEMIEVPVVAEGGMTPSLISTLAPVADFIAPGPELWRAEDPRAVLLQLVGLLR